MLVLSRRPGESIVIGNQVVVTILEVRGDQVRVGVDAPREVQVHREEVFRQLEAENAQAAGSVSRAQQMVARGRMPGGLPGGGRTAPPPNDAPGVDRRLDDR